MNGTIDLLNVGDGDAIIISLSKEEDNLVIVIDGGENRHYLSKVKPILEQRLQEKGKTAPDIVVATHYDSDHIGGLIPLIEDYIGGISEVWVHRSPELSRQALQIFESRQDLQHLKSRDEFLFEGKLMSINSNIKEEAIMSKSNFVIESLKQLDTFLGKIPVDKVKHVYSGYSPSGWPEIKVLGPTEDFYNSLFPNSKTLGELIVEETIDYMSEGLANYHKRFTELANYGDNPCDALKTEASAKLTPTNKASIIISLDKENDRFLFTGDAGITSFKEIPDWKNQLKNLFWLKIPHHGSDNNISTEIIDIMKPKFADSSGDRHQDNHVLGCISKNNRSQQFPRSTKSGSDLLINI